MSSLDPGYQEILEALYLGTLPELVPAAAVPRFRAESLRRRLHISSGLQDAFPRAAFYASALHGDACLEGVCRELIPLAQTREKRLLTRIEDAARIWATKLGDPIVRALFAYDDLILRWSPYTGRDRDRIRSAADLPETFGLGRFDHDMIAFGQHVDQLARCRAPASLVREYQPIARLQRLAVFGVTRRDGAEVVVRDVTRALEAVSE